jgi:hypothetical protein
MIESSHALVSLRSDWQGVVRMRERVRHLVVSTFAFDCSQSPTFADVLYNLPLVLAFDVLTKVLLIARDEGRFASSSYQLDELMDSAKTAFSWLDWQYLRDAAKRRNEIAQSAKFYGDLQCLLHIAKIEDQLRAWGIVPVAATPLPLTKNKSFKESL